MTKIVTSPQALKAALAYVSNAVPTRHTIPLLQHVALIVRPAQMTIVGSSMDLEARSTIDVEAGIEEETLFAAPTKILREVIAHCDNEKPVSLDYDDGRLLVTQGRTRHKMGALDARDYPLMSLDEVAHSATLPSDVWRNLICLPSFAAHPNAMSNYALQGVYLDVGCGTAFSAASDDKRIFAWRQLTGFELSPIIIPSESIPSIGALLKSAPETTLSVRKKTVSMVCGQNELHSAIINVGYPNVHGLLPKEPQTSFSCKVADLSEAVSGAIIAYLDDRPDAFREISIEPAEAGVRVQAFSQKGGEALREIDVEERVDFPRICVNSKWILDATAVYPKGAIVRVGISGPGHPMVLTSPQMPEAIQMLGTLRRG